MSDRYKVSPTSRFTAELNDVELVPTHRSPSPTRRRIVRPTVVDNAHDKAKSIEITLMHQRRASAKTPWQDAASFRLATLKAGEEVRLALDSSETHDLYKALQHFYAIGARGIPDGEQTLVVTDDDEAAALGRKAQEIIAAEERYGERLWKVIDSLDPHFLQAAAMHKEHLARAEAVEVFREHMAQLDWSEAQWQDFFEAHIWIFGQNLAFQFLRPVQDQPHYGGMTLSGKGTQRGDMLMSTEAQRRFTVLVEIKKPDTLLLETKTYRNKVYELGRELAGGVSQVLSNCRTWEREGTEQEANRERLRQAGIYTYEPKGILVIGHTDQLKDLDSLATFELFRRNLRNPEILTYDELLARAEYLVSATTQPET